MFKYFTSIVATTILLASCSSNTNKQEEVSKPKTTVVLLYDISTSNDEFALLSENHLITIFNAIASKGGGKFYSYLIKSNSRKQEVFEYDIPSLDTLKLKGNVYQIKKKIKANLKIRQELEIVLAEFIAQCKTKLLVTKTEAFTDLVSALELAKITLEQPNVSSTNANLLIISDGINDLPPVEGIDKLDAVDFKSANVILVRPTNKSFIIGQPTVTNSIYDGIINFK